MAIQALRLARSCLVILGHGGARNT